MLLFLAGQCRRPVVVKLGSRLRPANAPMVFLVPHCSGRPMNPWCCYNISLLSVGPHTTYCTPRSSYSGTGALLPASLSTPSSPSPSSASPSSPSPSPLPLTLPRTVPPWPLPPSCSASPSCTSSCPGAGPGSWTAARAGRCWRWPPAWWRHSRVGSYMTFGYVYSRELGHLTRAGG